MISWLWVVVAACVSSSLTVLLMGMVTAGSCADDWEDGYRAGCEERIGKPPGFDSVRSDGKAHGGIADDEMYREERDRHHNIERMEK